MFYFTGTRKPDFTNIKKIDYNKYWESRGFSINAKLKEREEIILKMVPAGSMVADIGCGNSLLPIKLKEKGVNIEVFDISEIVLSEYKKYNIITNKIDLENLKDSKISVKYDYIIMSEVLEHLSDPESVIKYLKTHTKNFILTIPNSAFYRYRIHLFFFGRFFTQWVHHPSEHLRYWSHIDFKDWLKSRGLKIVHTESSNGLSIFGLPIHKWWPNMFGHQICYIVSS